MNAPRRPGDGHEPTPDPDEPIVRWEVTGCVCGLVIARPVRGGNRAGAGWRHVTDTAAGTP